MIEVRGLEFAFHQRDFRLRVDSLSIPDGRKAALIGPSGSGKTTLLNLLGGIYLPRAGSIRIAGHEMTALCDAARRNYRIANIGFVFQDFQLIEYLSVRDNILHPFRINRSLRLSKEVRRRAEELADQTGLGERLHHRPDELSQGERQRAAICRALLPRPSLLLADEPTGNLDPAAKDHILQLLFDQANRTGATLVTVTHDHGRLGGFDQVIDFAQFHGRGCDD